SPCLQEFRHLESIYPKLKTEGIGVLAIDRIDSADKVAKFVKSFPLHLPVALSGSGANAVDPAFGVEGSPTTVVVNAKGVVVGVFEGEDDDGLARVLKTL